MSDEKVLSQADIDAILAKSAQRPAAAVATSQQQNVSVNEPKIAPKVKAIPQKTEIARPLNSIPQKTPVRAASPSEVEILRATVADLRNRLDRIEATVMKSQKVSRCDIKKMFHCDSCNSQGMVALYTKCTNCGKENWWGWWPKK